MLFVFLFADLCLIGFVIGCSRCCAFVLLLDLLMVLVCFAIVLRGWLLILF